MSEKVLNTASPRCLSAFGTACCLQLIRRCLPHATRQSPVGSIRGHTDTTGIGMKLLRAGPCRAFQRRRLHSADMAFKFAASRTLSELSESGDRLVTAPGLAGRWLGPWDVGWANTAAVLSDSDKFGLCQARPKRQSPAHALFCFGFPLSPSRASGPGREGP